MNWTEKYRPKSFYEVIGNEDAKVKLLKWIRSWKSSDKYGVLLVGPPGVGKTASVYALANDLGYHVIELNASDHRTAEKILEKLGSIAYGNTLESYIYGKRRKIMIFFDEIDGIDPKEDRGGLNAVLEIASKKTVPVIASANFIDPIKHKELLDKFYVIEYRRLTPKQIYIIVKRIAEAEKINIEKDILIEIARRSRGDARLAINMLYTASIGGDLTIVSNPLEDMPLDMLLRRVSSSSNLSEIKILLDANSNHWEEVIYTYFDIIARSPVIKPERREYLLDHISNLDVLMGRMNRDRAFFLMKYISSILSYIIYQANRWGAVYDGRIPEYRLYVFVLNKDVRAEMDDLFEKLKNRLHESRRKFVFDTVLPAALSSSRKYRNLLEWVIRMYGIEEVMKSGVSKN